MFTKTTMQFGGPEDLLDLYRDSEVTSPQPLVVWVHGGAWMSGDRGGGRAAARAVDGTGWSVMSMSYPLIAEGSPNRVEDQVTAVWNSIKYIHDRRAELGVDTRRVLLTGFSAGGHLSALTLLRPDLCPGRREAEASGLSIQRYFGLDGAGYDVPFLMNVAVLDRDMRLVFGTNRTRWAALSPVHRLGPMNGRFPPSDFGTGTSVYDTHARRMIQALKDHGVPAREVPTNLPHEGFTDGLNDPGPLRTAFLAAMQAIG